MQRICNKTEKPTAFYIFMSTLFHMRKMIQEYSAVTQKGQREQRKKTQTKSDTLLYLKKTVIQTKKQNLNKKITTLI